ncbi:hypothetical protein P2318_28355 [Myxococcaceae bacterium GXIMD 01537]
MTLVVVPPCADATLEWVAAPGESVLDVSRAFVRRAVSPALLTREADAWAADAPTPERLRAVLQLRTAALLLVRGESVHGMLRAAGAALAGLSGPPSPVRIRLDDLELAEGSTESSADVLRAVGAGAAPYRAELDGAVERMREAGAARLVLDRDQQLPAALWLADAARVRLQVVGDFALAHVEALRRLPAFARAEFLTDAAAWRVAGLPGFEGEGARLPWRTDATHPPPAALEWGGSVTREELARPDALVRAGCRVAVVGFCSLGEDVLDSEGHRWEREAYAGALAALRHAGVRVVAEWWVGAPGVDTPTHERTARELEHAALFDGLAGLRTFHWPRHRLGGSFGGMEVRVIAPPSERDLARHPHFFAPGTVGPEELPALTERLARQLMRTHSLCPGRVAQGYSVPPLALPERGERVRGDPDCAVVELPAALDGRPGPVWYAANLRTGTVLALDGRLAPGLAALHGTVSPAEALPRVPEAQRARVLQMLVEKGVLLAVRA